MADVTSKPTSNFLITASQWLLFAVAAFAVLVGVFAFALPFALQNAIEYPATSEQASSQVASTATPTVIVTVPSETGVSSRAQAVGTLRGEPRASEAPIEMELGEHVGSGMHRVSSQEEIDRLAGATVDTGSGYRVYGQPINVPNGTVCRRERGERICVPGVCTTDPQTNRRICRPT